MRLHHEQPVVFWWTLLSNLVVLVLGAGFLRAGIRLWRGRPGALSMSRRCAQAFLIICVGSAVIVLVYLVPALRVGLTDPARHAEAVVLLASVLGATAMMPVFPALTWWLSGRFVK